MRAPLWLIALIVLLIIGIGVYGYFTTPLPFGLNSVVRTPGGSITPVPTGAGSTGTAAGQPLQLGALTVAIDAVQRDQDVFGAGQRGASNPANGTFTVVQLSLQNAGSQAITLQPADFQMVDDRGRTYAVDTEATRMASQTARRRAPFDATVPPGGRLDTALAFQTAADAGALSLRVTLGYGEVNLPR